MATTYRITLEEAYDVEYELWRDANPDSEYDEAVDEMLLELAAERVRRDA